MSLLRCVPCGEPAIVAATGKVKVESGWRRVAHTSPAAGNNCCTTVKICTYIGAWFAFGLAKRLPTGVCF